jgi:tetratricopeptide (TPR) repeat protein
LKIENIPHLPNQFLFSRPDTNFLNSALSLDPKDAPTYAIRGFVWYKKGEYDKAIADYDKAIDLDPKHSLNYADRGLVWSEKGQYNKAIADYDKAIDLDPKHTEDYYNRGQVWSKKGEYDKAIADYDKSIELDPKHAATYTNRGLTWSKKGEYNKAIADYEKAIDLDSKNDVALNNKAWILATCPNKKFRDGRKAVELAQKAVELKSSYFHLGTLAAAFAEVGNFKEAITYQEKAIELLKQEHGNEKESQDFIRHLDSYKAGKPWREK